MCESHTWIISIAQGNNMLVYLMRGRGESKQPIRMGQVCRHSLVSRLPRASPSFVLLQYGAVLFIQLLGNCLCELLCQLQFSASRNLEKILKLFWVFSG